MSEIAKLRELLKKGKVPFTFQKKDGSVRHAVGTTNASFYTYERKGTGNPAPADMVVYWDCEKDAWRSFHETQLLSVEA